MVREGEEVSNRAIKLRLYPTKEQIVKMQQNMNSAIVAYNYGVRRLGECYEEWYKVKKEFIATIPDSITEKERIALLNAEKKKYILSPRKIRTEITALVKSDEKYEWMKQCDSIARCFAFEDLDKGLKSFLDPKNFNNRVKENNKKIAKAKAKGQTPKYPKYPYDYGFPKYKSCKDKEKAYPTVISKNKLDTKKHRVFIPKIGYVRYSSNQEIPYFDFPSVNLSNCRVSTDGRNYYLSFGFYQPNKSLDKPVTDVLGVDLGLKELAILSDGTIYENMANEKRVIKLNNKIKKLQRKYNWLQDHSEPMWKLSQEVGEEKWKKEKWKHETRQMRKIANLKRKIQIKINNIKNTAMKNYASEICKRNPECIVVENLNVSGMKKNKKLSGKLQQTPIYTFKQRICITAKKYNITVKEVDRFYPSSQECSVCGARNPEMKNLSKRTFVCPECGHTEDRDVNAAKNLRKMANDVTTKIIV